MSGISLSGAASAASGRMRVRMLTSIVGPRLDYRPGEEAEFDSATALRLIQTGQAEPVKAAPEAAVKPAAGRHSRRS